MKRRLREEKGFTLIEVIIAGALVSLVGVTLLLAFSTGSRGLAITDQRATAESLARSQMEYVRNQPYYSGSPISYALMPDIPAEFTVTVTGQRLDPKGDGTAADDGIQKITVTVSEAGGGPVIVTLTNYRSAR